MLYITHSQYKPYFNTFNLKAANITLNQSLQTTSSPTFAGLTITNAAGASLKLKDSGGGADDKTIEFDADSGICTVRSLTDAGATLTDNILTLDFGNGRVGRGIAAPLAAFHVGTGTLKVSGSSGLGPEGSGVEREGITLAYVNASDTGRLTSFDGSNNATLEMFANKFDIYYGSGTNKAMGISALGHIYVGTSDQSTTAVTGGLLRGADMVGGTTSDANGADLTISAGLGTGTGDEGQIIFQTPRKVGSGSTIQTRSTLFTLDNTSALMTAGTFHAAKGSDIASANDSVLVLDGNYFDVTGTTQMNGLTSTGIQAGTEITLQFDSNPVVKHNTAPSAGYAAFLLAAAGDFNSSADDTLTVVFDGTYWREKARTVI